MEEVVKFNLDGEEVLAKASETIWDVAFRNGNELPHLCHSGEIGYRPDGNCRACMVEIEGERTLAASCIRKPTENMVVKSANPRSVKARKMVMELLLADQPEKPVAHDQSSHLFKTAELQDLTYSRFPRIESELVVSTDDSHSAMRVNLDACIHCGLCARACREVQVNDVIGMAGRGRTSQIVFDFADPMGNSTCVACGECVQACPTGALMPASIMDENQIGDSQDYQEEITSVCPFCGVGCQISLKIDNNQIKYVDGYLGPANEQRLCIKGRFGFDYISHPHRLTKPLIRKKHAPAKGLNVDPGNFADFFREASWDEALALTAGQFSALSREFGGKTIAGFGSAKCTNEEAYLFQKLIRQGFGHNNVDHCTRLCHASSVSALIENIGSGAVTATFNEIENADVAIIIGANPIENHPVAATYFKQFAKRGGTLILMDPRGSELKRYTKYNLNFQPGTDVSMLNAIMHTILEEELYDTEYIGKFTKNWDALKEHLADFTPEKMAEICKIDAPTLREVARVFATGKAGMIFWGMGISQHIHGTDNSRCLISLALMCGHVGKPGTGLHPLRGQNNVQGASDAGLIPMFLPDYQGVENDSVRSKFTNVWNSDDFSSTPGLTVTEIIEAIHEGNIRSMYILGENPAMSDPDVVHARQALEKLDFLVVQDIFLTETANYADVILPAAAFAEKNGTVTNTNRQVQMGRKAVAAPGEAMEDWWITNEVGKRMGLNWNYTHPSEIFAEMKLTMQSLDNITWQRLEKQNSVTYPCESPEDPGQSIVFGDGFPTRDGLANFTPANIIPPDELPDDEFPMILITGRQLEHWHTGSMTRRSRILDSMEPEAVCSLHPSTLRNLGVEAGGNVRLETRRGTIHIKAREDRNIPVNSVFVPFAFVEAAGNILTNPAVDPYGKIPEFKFSAVKIDVPVEQEV